MSSIPRRRRRKKTKSSGGEFYDISILPNGAITAVAAPQEELFHYLELHTLVPEDIHLWPEARIGAMARQLDSSSRAVTWERTLMLLAHHRSQAAHDLLMDLEPAVPAELSTVWEMARGESLGWLGNNFHRDGAGNMEVMPVELGEVGWTVPGEGNN